MQSPLVLTKWIGILIKFNPLLKILEIKSRHIPIIPPPIPNN